MFAGSWIEYEIEYSGGIFGAGYVDVYGGIIEELMRRTSVLR